ncbi:MAG: hypothetical protein NZ455_15485, partial [Bacteroidia bacterium]|nr:hypothetical protein [Bacteroidia bacterium]
MLKTISAIFCTVWIYHFCIAQYSINQVFYNEVTTKNFSIKYNPAETNHPTNVIFNRIKNHYNKPINLLEWSIQIKLQRKLTLRPAQQFEIYVAQTEYTFSGDNIYRGFNIENKVKPAIQSIKIQLKHKTARTASPYYEKVFYANDFHPPILVQENYAYTKDSISLSDYELNIVEVVLNNSPEQTTAFLSFADKIDQYYTDSQTLPALLYQTMSVQSTNIDLLPMEEQKLIAVEQKINAIIAQRYMEELELNKQDPANFSAQMNQVMTLAAQKRNEINQTKANAHII